VITAGLLSVLFAAGTLVTGLIPDWTAPAFITSLPGYVGDFGDVAGGFAAWVPLTTALTVIGAVLGTFTLMNGVRFSLWLWSKLPVVGK
jgi:hypothetical protein